MNKTTQWVYALFGVLFLSSAFAQETGNDQADVWTVVESQWNADESGDKKWIDDLLTDDFAGWPNASPAPRNKASTRMWDRMLEDAGEMKGHELYPLSIIVHGDVAIAHYLYTSVTETDEKKLKVENGRYTDVLVRTEDGWKFISWHGGADPGK